MLPVRFASWPSRHRCRHPRSPRSSTVRYRSPHSGRCKVHGAASSTARRRLPASARRPSEKLSAAASSKRLEGRRTEAMTRRAMPIKDASSASWATADSREKPYIHAAGICLAADRSFSRGAKLAMERRLAAIFAADVAGYSRLVGADEEGTLDRLRAHRRELIGSKIPEHQGRIVKTTGDGVLAEFASPVKAVRCAIEVQHGMLDRNADVPQEQRIEFRIGINLGDVVVEEGDIY